ncbi:hypothetical protein Anas_12174 [Armadillidium nasatum]|uniref:DH domain-containing protein n=1 Tax=Armadillidium nasatum TaxID=96803 RepID=A0A5N5SN44_9CRUS|nr:hypothetical protein Anas_12174 [Armadillidium nasatum]
MDSYRPYYEYPPTQASIQVIPVNNASSAAPIKNKRSWGSILRFTGRTKKDREGSPSHLYSSQPTIYSPPFSIPQSYNYSSPSYSSQNVQFIANTPPYKNFTRNALPDNKERFQNYSSTYSKASGNVIKSIPPLRDGKNTVRYTDWFGSVVGRKPAIRPPLPLFQNSTPLAPDKNIPTVTSWDNYVSIQNRPKAVEIPAFVPLQSYNICMCPDQIFSTKSKKKKKFPGNAQWAWSQTTKPVYSPPHPLPIQNQLGYIRKEDDDEDSTPPTPETIRSIRSARSARSNESNSTITQETFSTHKVIPPPPSVPLPSIPKFIKKSSIQNDKRPSIITSKKTAYDFIERETYSSNESDTDDLSDNAVDCSWESHTNERDDDSNVSYKNAKNSGKINWKNDNNKVKIFTSPSNKVGTEKNLDNIKRTAISKVNHSRSNGYAEYGENNFNTPESNSRYQSKTSKFASGKLFPSNSESNLLQYANDKSSHINNKNYKAYNNHKDVVGSLNDINKRSRFERDSSKVVSIAGQRILLDKKQPKKTNRSMGPKISHLGNLENNEKPNNMNRHSISDWDLLQDYVKVAKSDSNKNTKETIYNEEDENSNEYWSTKQSSPNNFNHKTNDHRRSIVSTDVRDTIPEEVEEEEEEKAIENVDLKQGTDENLEAECEKDKEIDMYEERKKQLTYDNSVKINGYHNDNDNDYDEDLEEDYDESEDNDNEKSNEEPPNQINGFHPTLSELLKVKSILKRPNSLDTSSETDSDFYLQTYSDIKENLRKKKSVQFRPTDEVTLVEGNCQSKGRKVSSIKATRKEREKTRERKVQTNIISELHDIYERNNNKTEFSPNCNEGKNEVEVSIRNEERTDSANSVSNVDLSSNENNSSIELNSEENEKIYNEGSGSLRRTLSHRQTVDVSAPSFSDTYRLRQTSRPSILHLENSPLVKRKPTRKAPPPPKNATSPTRPTEPPPPPPPPQCPLPPSSKVCHPIQTNTNKVPSESDKQNYLDNEDACYNDLPSSLSSTSLSPPPSPPPPLPSSSPPPLPSSSPPPLDDDDDDDETIRDNFSHSNLSLSSFNDHKSPVSNTARSQPQVRPSSDSICFQDFKETLSLRTQNSSIFKEDEGSNIATIRGRIHNQRPSSYQQNGQSSKSDSPTKFISNKRYPKIKPLNSAHRLSFLSSMVEETEGDERLSDHIYEELPSLPSSPTGSIPNFQEKSIFDGASKYEILEFLQDARNRVNIAADDGEDLDVINPLTSDLNMVLEEEEYQNGVDNQDELLTSRYMDGRSSNRSSNSESSENSGLLRSDKEKLACAEVERTDSGVGSETSKPLVSLRRGNKTSSSSSNASSCLAGLREGDLPPCDDCDSPVEAKVTNSGVMYAPLVCRRCTRRRQERKEILSEIMETEVKYGRDLKVMMDQFCRPMRIAGLLSREQLEKIFLNIDELIEYNRQFSLQLRDAYEIAMDQGDEDLQTVNVAETLPSGNADVTCIPKLLC